MDVRPYRAEDTDTLYHVCLKTGLNGGADFSDPRLLGEIYVRPYLEFEPELAFVVADDDGPAGYVVGARDSRAFEETCEKLWWPQLRRRYPLDAHYDEPDATYVRHLHHPHVAAADIVAEYPSHLHINQLDRTRGHGMGRVLVQRLLDALRAAGSPGVHLGVGKTNTNAVGFYRHLGFTVLEEGAGALFMGRSTQPLGTH